MPELIDIDPIIICPNNLKCTKRKATVKSPNMVRVQPIVRCPEQLKCPPTFKSRGNRSPIFSPLGSPSLYRSGRRSSPNFHRAGRHNSRSPSLCHGGIIIIPRNQFQTR